MNGNCNDVSRRCRCPLVVSTGRCRCFAVNSHTAVVILSVLLLLAETTTATSSSSLPFATAAAAASSSWVLPPQRIQRRQEQQQQQPHRQQRQQQGQRRQQSQLLVVARQQKRPSSFGDLFRTLKTATAERAVFAVHRGGGGGDGHPGSACEFSPSWLFLEKEEETATTTATNLPVSWSVIDEDNNNKQKNDKDHGYKIVKEWILHDQWRRLICRRVEFPKHFLSSQQQPQQQQPQQEHHKPLRIDFELVGQKGTDSAVLIFVWNTRTKTCTIIQEYMPSTHQYQMGLAAGMVDADKHSTTTTTATATDESSFSSLFVGDVIANDAMILTAAQHELEEECRMTGGTWILLTPRSSSSLPPGITMDKYSTTRLSVFLVLDAVELKDDQQSKPRDDTEDIKVFHNISIQQVCHMISSGQMTVVGSWASLLAIEKLRQLGEIQ